MPNVLIISSHCPDYAAKGCATRLATIVEHLFQRDWKIDFLHVGRRPQNVAALPVARRCVRSVQHLGLKQRAPTGIVPKPIRTAARPSRSLVVRQFDRWSQRLRPTLPIDQEVLQVIRQTEPDVVWVDHTLLAALLPPIDDLQDVVWVVDTHDVMHLRDESRLRAGLDAESEVSRAEEIELLQRFHLVVAIQRAERAVFERMLPGQRVVTVEHAGTVRPMAASRPTLCFVGSKIDVNLQGISLFLEHAWPTIAARCPQAHIEIVGSVGGSLELTRFASRSGGRIVLRGIVPEIEDIYDGPAVMICPLWAGSGLKIKMVEALNHGKATVTTPIGAQGLEDGIGKAFLMARTPEDFVEPVLRLLDNPLTREHWEANALAYSRRRFSRDQVWGELDAELDRCLHRPRHAALEWQHSKAA